MMYSFVIAYVLFSFLPASAAVAALFDPSLEDSFRAARSRMNLVVPREEDDRGIRDLQMRGLCTPSDIEDNLREENSDPSEEDRTYFFHFAAGDEEVPIRFSCTASEEKCPYYIYSISDTTNDNDVSAASATTAASDVPPEPQVILKPCVRCEFIYKSFVEPVCIDYPCDEYKCVDEEMGGNVTQRLQNQDITTTTNQEETPAGQGNASDMPAAGRAGDLGDDVGSPVADEEPDQVKVCIMWTRVDYMSISEVRSGSRYGCSYRTALKYYKKEYTEGVTNLRETVEIFGDSVNLDKIEEDKNLNICTYMVDDVACNSCTICGEDSFNIDMIEVDCSNIVKSAVTSCDFLYDSIEPKLLLIQDGYVPSKVALPPGSTTLPSDRGSGGMAMRPSTLLSLVLGMAGLYHAM